MRTCIFCTQNADSKEHVFGQALIERMKLTTYPVRTGHRLQNTFQLRREHGLDSLRCRVVCRKCNNGWMSELEGWFLRRVGFLIEPQWPRLADTMIEALQTESRTLAKWALKTAIMVDKAGLKKTMIPDSFATGLFNDILPDSLKVDLGEIARAAFAARIAPGFMMSNGGRPIAWQSHKDGLAFQAGFQLNHLGVRIFCAPGTHANHVNPRSTVMRMFPPERIPQNHYVYESLDQFIANLVLTTDDMMTQ